MYLHVSGARSLLPGRGTPAAATTYNARTEQAGGGRYTRPCIMDLKMGVRTAETTAPLKKRVRMKAADLLTSCHSDGVQLIAMSVYQRSQHKQLKSSKNAVRGPSPLGRVRIAARPSSIVSPSVPQPG